MFISFDIILAKRVKGINKFFYSLILRCFVLVWRRASISNCYKHPSTRVCKANEGLNSQMPFIDSNSCYLEILRNR